MSDEKKKLKEKYDFYAGIGKKDGMEVFKSTEFAKLVKDAKLIINQGNKFNLKPPNRVDYVFTYACTNGPGGFKGNKKMSFEQFLYAVKGIAKETGHSVELVTSKLASADTNYDATKAVSTRFHDDASNYTGTHKMVHNGDAAITEKAAIRANRAMAEFSKVDWDAYTQRKQAVDQIFSDHDNGDGNLDAEELVECLRSLKPDASQDTLNWVKTTVMKMADANNDGKLSKQEFYEAYNMVTNLLQMMGNSSAVSNAETLLLKGKYISFCDCQPGKNCKREEEMDSARFKKLCQDIFPGTFPKTQAGTTKADLIFAKLLAERNEKDRNKNKITFEEFRTVGLVGICKEVNEAVTAEVTIEDIVMKILKSNPKTDATEADSVRFHDDKSSYTGAHLAVHGQVRKARSIKTADW